MTMTMPSGRSPSNARERVYVEMEPGNWYTSAQLAQIVSERANNIAPMMHQLHAEGRVDEYQSPGTTEQLQTGQYQWRRR